MKVNFRITKEKGYEITDYEISEVLHSIASQIKEGYTSGYNNGIIEYWELK